jgi:ubiquinone/menaquinone biosynthesis C-methylase UbiE
MRAFDAAAPSFERYRALPDGVPEAIRAAVLESIARSPRPRLLDLGAGSGRIGRAFVAAGDDYVGVDLSFAMLREFRQRAEGRRTRPRVAQADGQSLPFADASFDAVMLIHAFGAFDAWRPVLLEALRVLRSAGTLVTGHARAPADGVDAQMKQRLASLLRDMGAGRDPIRPRDDVMSWLESVASDSARVIAAEWDADRGPRQFLDRHRTGARFSALPEPIREPALEKLSAWAAAVFGSLEARCAERHAFEVRVFRFPPGMEHPCRIFPTTAC